jgi:uncharacterized membrane protein
MENESPKNPGLWQTFIRLVRLFWDILVIIFSTFFIVILIQMDSSLWFFQALRIILGIFLTLIAPGYCLTIFLFAKENSLGIPTRLAFSFGLSAALHPLMALMLDRLSLGIHQKPILQIVLLWILLNTTLAVVRRFVLLSKGQAYIPPAPTLPVWWQQLRTMLKVVYAAVALFLVGIVLVLINGFLVPALRMHVTEFYMLNADGQLGAYPRSATMGEPLQVLLGIVNKEGKTQTYRVEIRVEDSLNPDRRALVKVLGPFTLADGERREMQVSWSMPWAGKDQKVEFVLFMAGKSQPYRTLHFWLDQVAEADEQ